MDRRIAASLLVVLAGLVPPPIAAAPPLILRETIDDVAVTQRLCGFPVSIHTEGTAVIHVFPTELFSPRVIITAPGTRLTFTNLATGESVWTPSVNMVMQLPHEDGTGTKTLRGLLWHLIVPGQGLVTADVGRLDVRFTFDDEGHIVSEEVEFSAGQQDGEFLAAMCSALAA